MQLLMKNGPFLSGKKTKHIQAKFFFIKDRINDGEMIVVNCPTEGNVGRHLNKTFTREGVQSDEIKIDEL